MTRAWQLYERGRTYNNRLVPNQYNLVETNTEFFAGNQWIHLPQTPAMRSLPQPTFNILKRVASLFIASLTSNAVSIHVEPLAYYDGGGTADPDQDAVSFANAEIGNLMEKFDFEYLVRSALQDGVITGDYCAHFWFDPDARPFGSGMEREPYAVGQGEIRMELVDGINVMFGNPNDRNVENQPWILLVGRDTVENLNAEAEQFRRRRDVYRGGTANENAGKSEWSVFTADAETQDFAGVGGKTEIESGPDDEDGKALYVLLYSRKAVVEDAVDEYGEPIYEDVTDDDGLPGLEKGKDGGPLLDADGMPVTKKKKKRVRRDTILVTKATRNAYVYENVDTGLSRYPIAWGNWEEQKNQYHGRALVTGLIPNQIGINQTMAMLQHYINTMAFPKIVYNADLIPRWDGRVGQAIGIHGLMPGQAVSQVAYPLPGSEVSGAVFSMVDRIAEMTKEVMGATDVALGNVKPDNTSAIMVLQTQAQVPLENYRAGLKKWAEQCAKIMLDMMGTYYGERVVIVPRSFQEPIVGPGGIPQIDPMTGMLSVQEITRNVAETFDFSVLKHLALNLRIDAGDSSYYSEISTIQTLEKLRQDGTMNVEEFVARIPDRLIPQKAELLAGIRKRMATGQQANAAAGAAIQQPGSPMSGQLTPEAEAVAQSLPPNLGNDFADLPTKAQNAALRAADMRSRM